MTRIRLSKTFPTFYFFLQYAWKNTIYEIYKEGLFYPFLIAVYPALFLYSMNWKYVSFYELILPLAWILAAAFVLFSFVNLIVRDGPKTSALISFFLITFFSYGHFYEMLKSYRFFGHQVGHDMLLAACLIIYLVYAFVIAMPITREYFKRYLKIFSVLLVVLMSANFTRAVISDIQEYTTTYKNNSVIDLRKDFKARNAADYPDIYYIILDSYSGAGALKEFYNYDNGGFVSWLKHEGFVLPKTWSNYCQTALSIPSSLNMDYIDNITGIINRKTNVDLSPMKQLMARSAVAKFLKSRGYTVVKFVFGYTITDSFKADVTENLKGAFFLHEFTNQLANTTMLISMKTFFESELGVGANVRRIMAMLDGLPVVTTKIKSPKFVFAHIICPHPPFIFDKDGLTDKYRDVNINYSEGLPNFEKLENDYKNGYLGQIEFLNAHIKTTIDKIVRKSKRPPVIILQADHGSGMSYFTKIEKTNLYDRFSILNAYYLPDGGDKILYEGITPVNTFRMVLNYYFGTDLPRLPDRNYFTSGSRLYVFTEITDRLKNYKDGIPK